MNPLRTLRFAELLDHAWKATRAHLGTLLLPFALLLAPALVATNISSNYFSLKSIEQGQTDPFALFAALGVFLVVLFLFMLWMILVYRAMFIGATWAEYGQEPGWQSGLASYARPKVWGTDLLAVVLTTIGFMACILPGLFLMLAWSLRIPVMVREERFGFDALSRSWELMKFNPSQRLSRSPIVKALGALVVVVVLSTLVSLAIQLPVTAWTQYVTFKDAASGDVQQLHQTMTRVLWISLPFSVAAGLVQLGVTLYSYFILAALYADQRRRREGDDIAGRLDELTASPASGAVPPPAPPAPASAPATGTDDPAWQGESWTLPEGGSDE